MLFIITQRTTGVLIGHISRLKKSKHLGVSELNIEENSIFESPYIYNETPVIGVVLPHEIQLTQRANTAAILELLEDLNSIEEWQLRERPEVEYGPIEDVLDDEEEDERTDEENKDTDE